MIYLSVSYILKCEEKMVHIYVRYADTKLIKNPEFYLHLNIWTTVM